MTATPLRRFLAEDFSISTISVGCMRMEQWSRSPTETARFLEQCIERGVTTFDHADIYGGDHANESRFGEALKQAPGLRGRMEIVTKCGIRFSDATGRKTGFRYFDASAKVIQAQVENSLRSLGCSTIDLLLIHMHDLLAEPEEVGVTLHRLMSRGMVRHFGLSNHSPLEFDALQRWSDLPFVTNQVLLNPFNIENLRNETLTHCVREGIHPMVWSPLAGGRLFRPTDAREREVVAVLREIQEELGVNDLDQVVLPWLLQHPSRPALVLGTGDIERIERGVASAHISLTGEQWYRILTSAGYEFW